MTREDMRPCAWWTIRHICPYLFYPVQSSLRQKHLCISVGCYLLTTTTSRKMLQIFKYRFWNDTKLDTSPGNACINDCQYFIFTKILDMSIILLWTVLMENTAKESQDMWLSSLDMAFSAKSTPNIQWKYLPCRLYVYSFLLFLLFCDNGARQSF